MEHEWVSGTHPDWRSEYVYASPDDPRVIILPFRVNVKRSVESARFREVLGPEDFKAQMRTLTLLGGEACGIQGWYKLLVTEQMLAPAELSEEEAVFARSNLTTAEVMASQKAQMFGYFKRILQGFSSK